METLEPAEAGAILCGHQSGILPHSTSSGAARGGRPCLPDKRWSCQVEIYIRNLAQTSTTRRRLGDSGKDCLEYTLGLSPKGRIGADRLCLISLLPSHSFSQIFYCTRYLPDTHIYNSFPATKPTKCPDIESRFLPNTFSPIPMAYPSPVSTISFSFFFSNIFSSSDSSEPSPCWLSWASLLFWRAVAVTRTRSLSLLFKNFFNVHLKVLQVMVMTYLLHMSPGYLTNDVCLLLS